MKANFNVIRERHNKLFYKEYENDACVLQFHSHIELYFVDEGAMEFIVNGHRRILYGGEMSVALSYDSHAYKTPDRSKSSVLIIPVYLAEAFINATKHKKAAYHFITDKSTVKKIKGYIKELITDDVNEVISLGLINVILGNVMKSIFFENSETASDMELSSRILSYVNQHFKEDITLESLAHEFGYNKSYLSRYFKSSFNVGFNQYLSTVRLKNALILMNEKKHSLTHCALEGGFNSMRTFYRVFENEFNCSPKEYVKNIDSYNRAEKILKL